MSSEDTDAQTQAALAANRIASAAIAISIAALLIGYVQLLLGNLMSGNALWKTNHAAIGVAARYRSWRLGLRRVKILYPQINLRVEDVLRAARKSTEDGPKSFVNDRAAHHALNRSKAIWVRAVNCGERKVQSKESDEAYEPRYERTSKAFLANNLPWSKKLQFEWSQFNYFTQFQDRPRATWAQVIQALGIHDAGDLVINQLDADTVPSGIDVPVQRIRLFDLGRLALVLGCSTVELDVSHRSFRAVGPFCIITTEDIPTFGRAIRFEGDVSKISYTTVLGLWPKTSMTLACKMIEGFLAIGRDFTPWAFGMAPVKFDLHSPDYKMDIAPLYLGLESSTFSACKSILEEIPKGPGFINYDPFRNWQDESGQCIPTIIALSSFAGLPNAFCGFPTRLLLHPFQNWVARLAPQIRLDDALPSSKKGFEQMSRLMNRAFFLSNYSHILMTWRPCYSIPVSGLHGRLNWAWSNLLPEAKREIFPHQYSTARGYARPLIMGPCRSLLIDFDPIRWAETMDRQLRDHEWRTNPSKILWFQVLLLDISVRLQIKGSHSQMDTVERSGTPLSDERPSIVECDAITEAVLSSRNIEAVASCAAGVTSPATPTGSDSNSPLEYVYERNSKNIHIEGPKLSLKSKKQLARGQKGSPRSELRPWDLRGALEKYCNLYSDLPANESKTEYENLAKLLKLRAVFFIAFVMVGPDSSQVYEARASDAQVPMI